jgi:hypothetical protein
MTTASATAATAWAVAASRMPKPTPTGSSHAARMLGSMRATASVSRCPGAGHALERHVVDIAAGDAPHIGSCAPRWTWAPAGRSGPSTARRSCAAKVSHSSGGSPRPARRRRRLARASANKAIRAEALHRVRVTHQHHRRAVVGAAEAAHHVQHVAQPDAALKRSLAGTLDHRTVGHRVGERHAELDHVGAAAASACMIGGVTSA